MVVNTPASEPPAADLATDLPAHLRRARVLDLLGSAEFVRVADISERLGVTTVTARADLDALAAEGLLRRVHGGAIAVRSRDPERALETTVDTAADAKSAIGRAAADLVQSGETIILDVGSTALAVAHALVARSGALRNVTVVTNGLAVALALEPGIPSLTVIVTGGTLRPLQHSLVQPLATDLLDRVNADRAFVGCNGLDLIKGATNVNLPEVEMKRAMMRAAEGTVLMADSSKVGAVHVGRIAPLAEFDLLITDSGVTSAIRRDLAATGLPLLVAP